MTKPGFTNKRVLLAINEEAQRYGSTLQSNAFTEGAKFILNNLDAVIEKPFYVYVATFRDSKQPIVAAHTRETLELLLDEYCGATAMHNHSGKRLSYMAHNVKYPSDYEGYYMYEIKDGENLRIEHYDVYCVEFKAETNKLIV